MASRSSAKPTAGPWRLVEPTSPDYILAPEVVAADFGLVATLSAADGKHATAQANGKLIVAAPDLAAACEVFANIAQDMGVRRELLAALRHSERGTFERACNDALAALQKAGLR
jgi:hypothetical protein